MQKNRSSTTLPRQLETSNEDGDFLFGTHMENLLSYWVSQGVSDKRAAKFKEVYDLGNDLDDRFRKSVNEGYDHSDVNKKVFHNVHVLEELLAWDEVQHVQLFLTGQNATATSDISQTVKRYFILVKELMVEEFSEKSSDGKYSTMRRSCKANSFKSTPPGYQWMFDILEPAIRRSTRPSIEARCETSQDVFPRSWIEALKIDETFQHASSSKLQPNPAKAIDLNKESQRDNTSGFGSGRIGSFGSFLVPASSPFGAGSQGGGVFSASSQRGSVFGASSQRGSGFGA
ncbi:hypothetical protein FCOIX_10528 [Fusarium coicis]|nr:hypothetical protein FCOIX_10528 [Fusarium coicis]